MAAIGVPGRNDLTPHLPGQWAPWHSPGRPYQRSPGALVGNSPGTLGTKAQRPPPKGGRVGLKTHQEPRLLARAQAWATAQALSQNGNAIPWAPGSQGHGSPARGPMAPSRHLGKRPSGPLSRRRPQTTHWVPWTPMNPINPEGSHGAPRIHWIQEGTQHDPDDAV